MSKKVLKRSLQGSFSKWLLILVGTFVWSLTMVKSGLCWDKSCLSGLGFWGPNGHDGVWHIAVAESLSRGSDNIPVFAGESLKNYHLGFDLLLSFLHRISGIPISNLYFQIIPPVLAFLIGFLTYKFVLFWQKLESKAFWSTFFVYFGGSFGWIVALFRGGMLGGESMFWSQQSISTLINPPFALSLVIILLGLIYLLKYKEFHTTYYLLLATVAFGSLIQIKVYAGLLVLSALLVSSICSKLWLKEKAVFIFKVFLGSLLVSIVIFYPNLKSGSSLVVLRPFWFLETMMALPDRVNWPRFYSAMTNYVLGKMWLKAFASYLVAFVIFYYGNLGTRLITEIGVAKWIVKKELDWVKVFMIFVILMGAIVPTFFLQKGTPWNTIQFFYYSLFFLSILTGVVFTELVDFYNLKRAKVYMFGTLLIVLTLPTTLGTLEHYLPKRPPSMLPAKEVEALNFLAKESEGVVLTYPFDKDKALAAQDNPPRPLYLYESTAYVSAFGKKQVFLEDEVNLDITDHKWEERRKNVLSFYDSLSEADGRNFLKENNISYVYWLEDQRPKLSEEQLGLVKMFGNGSVSIYRVE